MFHFFLLVKTVSSGSVIGLPKLFLPDQMLGLGFRGRHLSSPPGYYVILDHHDEVAQQDANK